MVCKRKIPEAQLYHHPANKLHGSTSQVGVYYINNKYNIQDTL